MATLWDRFTTKLKDSGYTLNDLVYCSEDLFLTIVEDMKTFAPLEIAALAKEWRRNFSRPAAAAKSGVAASAGRPPPPASRMLDGSRLASSPTAMSSTPARAGPLSQQELSTSRNYSTLSAALRENGFAPPRRSPAKIKEEAEYLLTKLGALSGEEFQVSSAEGIVAVEASPEAWTPLLDRAARMHVGGAPRDPRRESSSAEAFSAMELQLLWKLCSPSTLRKMEKTCVSGAPFGLSNQDDTDGLCSSAVVLYHKEATHLAAPAQELAELFREKWALVAFDVAVGKARTVTKEEAQDLNANLYRFSMEQCLEMLEDAGFDSFHIPSRNAVAVCHMHQLMPRFVVFVSVLEPVAVTRRLGEAAPLAPALGAHHPSRVAPPLSTVAPSVPALAAAASRVPVSHGAATVAALRQPSPAEEQLQCSVHPQKTVEFWSPTEKRLLCSHCLYYDGYSRENCIPIEQAAREEAPRLEKWVQNAITFSQEINGVFDLFDAAQSDILQSHERVRGDIAQSFTRLRSRLDGLEASLQQQCQQKMQQNRHALEDTQSRVAATVRFVKELVQDCDEPVAAYRGGVADTHTCVSLLRSAQRAFGSWEPVVIAPYEDVSIVDGATLLQPVEEALKAVRAVTSEVGKVQLPEAIDANYLKLDCDT